MSAATIHLAGELLQLDPAGALHWPARRLLVVSDLHFEKGSAAARQGSLDVGSQRGREAPRRSRESGV